MKTLSPRERVALTLNHQEPDRVPISLGGSANHLTERRFLLLKDHFGFTVPERRTLVGFYTTPDYNPLLERLGTDMRFLHIRPPAGYISNPLLDGFQPFVDEWGLHHELVSGYYNMEGAPLANLQSAAELDQFPWPDPTDPLRVAGLKEEVEHLYHNTQYALVAHRPVYGNAWEMCRLLLGVERSLMMVAVEKELFRAVFDKISEVLDGFYDAFLDVIGPYVQIVEMAEDVGTNAGPMFNPKIYRDIMLPFHKRSVERIKKKAPGAKVMLHCDGAIQRFLPYFIEAGFEILNPIEAHLPGMDPAKLKEDFGKDLVFMGGVDVKNVLTKGTRADIRQEIRTRIEQMGHGGGYILAPAHNFGDDIPLENMLYFFEDGKELGQYPL